MKITEGIIACRQMIMTAFFVTPLISPGFIDLTGSDGFHTAMQSKLLIRRYCVSQEVIRGSISFTIPKMAQTSNTQGIYKTHQ
jgi:hypothetical protein